MDKKKQAYQEKVSAQIAEMQAEIDQLKAKADGKKADAKLAFQNKIDELEKMRESLETRVNELKSASASAWEDLQSGLGDALSQVKNSLDDARSNFS